MNKKYDPLAAQKLAAQKLTAQKLAAQKLAAQKHRLAPQKVREDYGLTISLGFDHQFTFALLYLLNGYTTGCMQRLINLGSRKRESASVNNNILLLELQIFEIVESERIQ